MRRLVGISFDSKEPVEGAFLRFGDVTVLTGRNDSGKTRVLRLIETALTEPERVEGVDVFGTGSREELAALVDPDDGDRLIVDVFVDAIAPWLDTIELPIDRDEIRVVVRLHYGGAGAWRFARAPIDLEPTVREAVEEALPEAASRGDATEPVKVEYLGRADWAILPEAITVPSPASAVAERVGTAVMSVCRSLQDLASEWMWFGERGHALKHAPPVSFVHAWPSGYSDEGPSWSCLIDEQRHASVVHPAAVEACAVLERIAAPLLPDFIAGEYRLEITPAQPSEIAQGRYVRLQLMRPDRMPFPEANSDPEQEGTDIEENPDDQLPVDPDDGALRFAIDDAPAGFGVWLQLALHEAAHRALIASHNLQTAMAHFAPFWEQVVGGGPSSETDEDLDDDIDEEPEPDADWLDETRQLLEHALGYLREPTLLPPRLEPAEDEPSAPYPEFDAPRHRVYLIDEPEQHLHPALERRAASWLSTAMSQWGAQCVIATHALAFIHIAGDRQVYELSRTGYAATIAPLDPATLTPYTPIARAIGLDRGELLSRYRAFVFLEHATAAVLEELFGERLDRSHIRLVPIELRQPNELPEITILAQLTAAPLAALLVSTAPEEIARLRMASALERTAAARQPGELGAVAAILELAVRKQRQIEILTLAIPDLRALLGDDQTRDAVTDRFEDAILRIEQQIIAAETAEQASASPRAPEQL
jgi:energy-coupling factor transporter ATP-binding protein EcfA2